MKASAAIELLVQLLNAAGPVSAAIRQAQVEGRELTADELQAAFDQDDKGRDALAKAIANATP